MTQEIIDFSYREINKFSTDAFNRADQKCRSYCDFTVLELINVTDRRHPLPVDPISKAFVPMGNKKIDPTKIEIAGNRINLEEIKKDVAFLTSQDKDHVIHMLVSGFKSRF